MSSFDRLFRFMINPWVFLTYTFIVVLSFFYFDKPIAAFFYQLDLAHTVPILKISAILGWAMLYGVGLFLAAFILHFIKPNSLLEKYSWFLWACVVFTSFICFFLKIILGRARPILWINDHLYGFFGFSLNKEFWSFPSGHMTTMVSLSLGLSILFPRYRVIILTTCISIAICRVLLVQHYLSDILGAGYLALLEMAVLMAVFKKKQWFTFVAHDKYHSK